MARRSGGRSSRSERKADRERARRAKQHGLPERREETPRRSAVAARFVEPSVAGESGAPSARSSVAAKAKKKLPPLVIVLGGAVLLLGVAYALTHVRDSAPTVAPAQSDTTAEPSESPAPPGPPRVEPEASAVATSAPGEPKRDAEPAVSPTAPATLAPVQPSVEAPRLAEPVVVAPKPVVVAPKPVVAAPKPVVVPESVRTPKSPLAPAPPAASGPDNPY